MIDTMKHPLMASSPRTLLSSLIELAHHLASYASSSAPKLFQLRKAASITRKLPILLVFFEELNHTASPLPPSAMLCFTELLSIMRRIKACLEDCIQSSCLLQLLDIESVSVKFGHLAEDMANALEFLPLKLLNMSEELREQVQLVYAQLRRPNPSLDPLDEQLRGDVLSILEDLTKEVLPETAQLREIMKRLSLNNAAACEQEILFLDAQISNQTSIGNPEILSTLQSLVNLVKCCKEVFFHEEDKALCGLPSSMNSITLMDLMYSDPHVVSISEAEQKLSSSIPDEFRCPISLDLMIDPVIIATGHTYERASITKWLESGHSKCPKSAQKLLHFSLIPNYALRSMISQWCEQHNIINGRSEIKKNSLTVDQTEDNEASLETARMTAAFLVDKLATGSPDIQKQVAYELRLLAKCGKENRIYIAEAGAIPLLVALLYSKDPITQENSVTALLNLSIYENNKSLIMASGGLDPIIEVLRFGGTTEARENAAATLFSLSVVDENKLVIGSKTEAIYALVNLLRDGSYRGKKDATTALFNLSLHPGNKPKVVAAGAIPLLVNLLRDEMAGMRDDALAVLAILAGCSKGLMAISETEAIPVLLHLLRHGSNKGKENSLSVLLALCQSGGENITRCILQSAMPSLHHLISIGSPRAKRKAACFFKLLDQYGGSADSIMTLQSLWIR